MMFLARSSASSAFIFSATSSLRSDASWDAFRSAALWASSMDSSCLAAASCLAATAFAVSSSSLALVSRFGFFAGTTSDFGGGVGVVVVRVLGSRSIVGIFGAGGTGGFANRCLVTGFCNGGGTIVGLRWRVSVPLSKSA